MSTHALVTIRDCLGDEVHLYRHMDGYPEGTMPSLEKLMTWIKNRRICSGEAGYVAGWLLIIGRDEYKNKNGGELEPSTNPEHDFWKSEIGAYEIVSVNLAHKLGVHHEYLIDLTNKTIQHEQT